MNRVSIWDVSSFLFILSLLLLIGCDVKTNSQEVGGRQKFESVGGHEIIVSEFSPELREGKWSMVETTYNGRKYVFLRNYDGDNQAIIKVDDFPVEK